MTSTNTELAPIQHSKLATLIAFVRSCLFYCVSIPSIFGSGFFIIPFIALLPLKYRWRFLGLLLNILMLQIKIICGINYVVEGKENIPNTPYVGLCKHQSPWETFFLFCLLKPVSMVMKRSLLVMPSFGWGIAMTKPIAIQRDKPKRAIKQLMSQGQQRLHQQKQPVLIFPEGTRVPFGQKGKYSRGGAQLAERAQVPVIFIAHNAGKFWPSAKFIKYPGTIRVSISKPVDTSTHDAKSITHDCEQWIEAKLYDFERA